MTSRAKAQAAAIARRGSPALSRATRSIMTMIESIVNEPRAIGGEYTQHQLAIVIGHIMTICDLTGEMPSQCMTRLRVPTTLRYHIVRLKGAAGDRMRALQTKKKLARRAVDPAVAAAASAATERQYNIAAEAFDSGMDAAKVWAYAEAEDARRQAALAAAPVEPLTPAPAPAIDGLGIEMEAADENEQGLPPQGAA